MIFGRKPVVEPLPDDPNERIIGEIYRDYPFGKSPFGVRSMIQLIVYVVLEMKKRGMI